MRAVLSRFALGVLTAATLCAVVPAAASHAADVATFHGLSPARLMDTRSGSPTVDGLFGATGPVGPAGTANVTVVGRGGVPATGVSAVAVNVTVTNPTATGYVTVFPTGATRPTASNLNYTAGQTIPNMVIVSVGVGGQISIYNSTTGTTDVVVDVLGWFPTGGSFGGVTPARLLDTRPGFPTVDAVSSGGGPVGPYGLTVFAAAGRGGVPATGAGAVALNVTVTGPTTVGYLTVYPAGSARPTASNLNFTPGLTIPNMVIVPLSATGQVAVYNGSPGTANVVVDVLGWFPSGAAFASTTLNGLSPTRLLDTRIGGPTIDGRFSGVRPILEANTLNVVVAGRGGVPASGVGAVALNVTVTNPTSSGYLTVYPAGTRLPRASNLNFVPRQTIPNMVIVPVGISGEVSIYNSAGLTDVVVDVLGWWPNPSSPAVTPGNDLTLRSTGIGTINFGALPAAVTAALSPVLGAPSSDRAITLTDPSGTGQYSSDTGDYYVYPFARSICFGDYALCADFGGATAASVTFKGYSYFGVTQASLFDANGVGINSRPSDFPGAILYSAGGCYSEGSGSTSTGILVGLHSEGVFFADVEPHLPAAADVYVTGFYAGQVIGSEGDC